jgi:hypothetical protein
MPLTALRAGLTVAAVAVVLAVPTVPASGTPASLFRIQNVSVTADPADRYHPIVSFQLSCSLPTDSPLRSGETQNTSVYLNQPPSWWHLHGPFYVPRPYTCGTTDTVRLTTDSPDGFVVRDGLAHVRIWEVIYVGGGTVQATYDRQVMVRTARS